MDQLIKLLKTGLDGAAVRHKALAGNIANLETPGYKRRDLDFTAILKARLEENRAEELTLEKTAEGHLSSRGESGDNQFRIQSSGSLSSRNDQNNVDIDLEMAELAKNTIYYNTLINRIGGKYRLLQDVISKASR